MLANEMQSRMCVHAIWQQKRIGALCFQNYRMEYSQENLLALNTPKKNKGISTYTKENNKNEFQQMLMTLRQLFLSNQLQKQLQRTKASSRIKFYQNKQHMSARIRAFLKAENIS